MAEPKPSKETKAAQADAAKARREAARAKAELAKERALALSAKPASHLQGFIEFIREKGVVGLAIGLAIGTAATGLVTQIVNSVITPTIDLIVGPEGLSGLQTTVEIGSRSATYEWGMFLDALIKFIAIAAVIYFVVLGLKLDRLDKKKE